MKKTIIKSLICICLMIAMVSVYAFSILAAEATEAVIETEATYEEQVVTEAAPQETAGIIEEEIYIAAPVKEETAVSDEYAAPAEVETATEPETAAEYSAGPLEEPAEYADESLEEPAEYTAGPETDAETEVVKEAETAEVSEEAAGTEAAEVSENAEEPEADEEDAELDLTAVLYTVNGVSLPLKNYEAGNDWSAASYYKGGSGCWAFALLVYEKIWAGEYSGSYGFTSSRGTSDNMLRNYYSRSELMTITPEHTREYITAASLGAVIRVCDSPEISSDGEGTYMHSMILVQKDSAGFTVYHGNWNNKILFSYYTWQEFASQFRNYEYFKYIKWPGAPAYEAASAPYQAVPAEVTMDTPKLTENGVKLSWNQASDADSYIIKRRVSGGRNWSTLASQYKGTDYEDITAVSGTAYEYSVTGYNSRSGQEGTSDAATVMYLAAPKDVTVTNTSSGLYLSWSAVTGADYYLIYRKASNGKYSYRKAVNDIVCLDETVEPGVEYYYRVLAYDSSAKQKSSFVEAGFPGYYLGVATASSEAVSSGIKITWETVKGADSYIIFRKTASGRYSVIASGQRGNEYTDTTAEAGTLYYYAVRAYNKTYKVYGGYKAVKGIRLAAPTVRAAASSGVVNVIWTMVTGAQGYRIYRKASGGKWKAVKTVTSGSTLKYVDSDVQKGTVYYYVVVPYTKRTGSVVWGLYNRVKVKAK